jgi:hypothetical protein
MPAGASDRQHLALAGSGCLIPQDEDKKKARRRGQGLSCIPWQRKLTYISMWSDPLGVV